ncbi:MAG: hypothetical protein AAF320_06560 [Myxococcota bacterium]
MKRSLLFVSFMFAVSSCGDNNSSSETSTSELALSSSGTCWGWAEKFGEKLKASMALEGKPLCNSRIDIILQADCNESLPGLFTLHGDLRDFMKNSGCSKIEGLMLQVCLGKQSSSFSVSKATSLLSTVDSDVDIAVNYFQGVCSRQANE